MYSGILFKQVQNPKNPLQQIKHLISSSDDCSAPYTNFRPSIFLIQKIVPVIPNGYHGNNRAFQK
jgi:hypothetical protein